MSKPDSSNPYASPSTTDGSTKQGGETFAPCPSCGSTQAKRVRWTLWGGAVGPKMFCHVKCVHCGAKFNGKTGKSNTTIIVIYLAVSIAIGLILFGSLPIFLSALKVLYAGI